MVYGTAVIGGFVVVGQMIVEHAVCTELVPVGILHWLQSNHGLVKPWMGHAAMSHEAASEYLYRLNVGGTVDEKPCQVRLLPLYPYSLRRSSSVATSSHFGAMNMFLDELVEIL